MLLTEAIEKELFILVENDIVARQLRKQTKYHWIFSHRAKHFDAAKGFLIDEAVDITKMNYSIKELEASSIHGVFFGDVTKNEYSEVMDNITTFIEGQADTIRAAVELRLLTGHITKFLQDLEIANPKLGLTDTINLMYQHTRKFDNQVVKFGPYTEAEYLIAVTKPFFNESEEDK